MFKITKIINRNNKIMIHHSNNVIDKRTEYDIQFDSVYKGYIDYYVSKEIVQSKKPQFGQLDCTIYLSTEKFLEDHEKWIEIFKKAYRDRFSNYKWYKELNTN